MQNIAAALVLEYPETNAGRDNPACCVYIVPLADRIVGDMAPTLTVVAGAERRALVLTADTNRR
jgi:hypothetical protein